MVVPVKHVCIVPASDYGYNAIVVSAGPAGPDSPDIKCAYAGYPGTFGSSSQHAFVTLDEAERFKDRIESAGCIDGELLVYIGPCP